MTPLQRASKMRLWGPKIDLAQPDQTILTRAYNPDELVTLFSGAVWRYVSAQVKHREDAEDVVMEVFAAAFRDFDRVRRADNQGHWLLAIARKKVNDRFRRHYRRAEQPISEADLKVDDMPDVHQLATRSALAGLPESQREVLTLKYVTGLSTEEVGQLTRRSTAATNSLLQRGRESLRQALNLGEEK